MLEVSVPRWELWVLETEIPVLESLATGGIRCRRWDSSEAATLISHTKPPLDLGLFQASLGNP